MARTTAMKVYRVERRSSILPTRVMDALAVRRHIRQGDVLVAARSIAAAKEALTAVGMRPTGGSIAVAHGDDVTALAAAGLLDEPGTILASAAHQRDNAVVSVTADSADLVGAWRYLERIGGDSPFKRLVFERLDGQRFSHATA